MHPMFARITKVDEATRTVTGRAAQEVVDRDNEMFDYASSKPEFMKWSAEVSADSGGKSLGNIRSMHGNVAAGKITNIDFNDVEKAIDISAKIIDNNEWEKVMEGVHTGFSIGGRYARKWAEPVNGKMVQRYTAVPAEISIVDRPCCPTAKFFTIHKRDGSIVKREFINTHEVTLEDGVIALIEKADDDEGLEKGGPGSGPHGGGKTTPMTAKSESDIRDARQKMQGDQHMASTVTDAAIKSTNAANANPSSDSHTHAMAQHMAAGIFQQKAAKSAAKISPNLAKPHEQMADMHQQMADMHTKASHS